MKRYDFIKVEIERIINGLSLYDDVSYAFNNFYLVKSKKNNLYGLINSKVEEVVPCEYQKHEFLNIIKIRQDDEYGNSASSLKVVTKDYYKGYVDIFSRLQIPYLYEKALPFSENLAAVRYEDNWGFIDERNNQVIDFKYQYAKSFKEGLAPVKKNGKWGYINRKDEEIIPFIFDKAFEFRGEYALVEINNELQFINKHGDLIKNKITETFFTNNILDFPSDMISYKILEYFGIFETENETIYVKEKSLDEYKKKVLLLESNLIENNLGKIEKQLKRIK